jgi:hypothetical protein
VENHECTCVIGELSARVARCITPCHSSTLKVPQCFHHTAFPSLFAEHSKTGKTRFSVCPYCQVTAYFVNVLLENTRIWETLKNVNTGCRAGVVVYQVVFPLNPLTSDGNPAPRFGI